MSVFWVFAGLMGDVDGWSVELASNHLAFAMDANLPEINITKGCKVYHPTLSGRFWGDFLAAIKPTFATQKGILSAQKLRKEQPTKKSLRKLLRGW